MVVFVKIDLLIKIICLIKKLSIVFLLLCSHSTARLVFVV